MAAGAWAAGINPVPTPGLVAGMILAHLIGDGGTGRAQNGDRPRTSVGGLAGGGCAERVAKRGSYFFSGLTAGNSPVLYISS